MTTEGDSDEVLAAQETPRFADSQTVRTLGKVTLISQSRQKLSTRELKFASASQNLSKWVIFAKSWTMPRHLQDNEEASADQDLTRPRTTKSHIAGYPLIKYSRRETIRRWCENNVKALEREHGFRAVISWQKTSHGYEKLKIDFIEAS